MQSNRLYLICKTTGTTTEIGRDYNLKPKFDSGLSGKASFSDRMHSSKESSMPRLPLYLRKQFSVLKKFESAPLNNITSVRSSKLNNSTIGGRLSVVLQLEDLEHREVLNKQKRYSSLQSQYTENESIE
jgi:hypothetical protein